MINEKKLILKTIKIYQKIIQRYEKKRIFKFKKKKNVEHYIMSFTKNEYFFSFLWMTQTFSFKFNLKILIEFLNIDKLHKIRKMKQSMSIIKQSV
jgi:hypothetical protein